MTPAVAIGLLGPTVSRASKKRPNDADRLRKYPDRFGVDRRKIQVHTSRDGFNRKMRRLHVNGSMEAQMPDKEKDKPKDKSKPTPQPNSPTSKLIKTMEEHRGERHIIILQDFPDPDAISTAFTHQLACQQYEIETDIVHCGRISHQQNVALVRLLNIELIRYEGKMDLKDYAGAVYLDNQGATAGQLVKDLKAAGVPTVVVVDHHESQKNIEAPFVDIRRAIGATASIYAEYLQQGFLNLDASVQDHVRIATALTHGIITDTNGFVHAQHEDFQAASYLSRFKDADLLRQIMRQERSRQTMEITERALRNRAIAESFSISGIGYLRTEDRDAIPQAADFMLTEENVHTAIVYGIVSGEGWEETLIGSFRTTKITLDPDQFIKEAFGKDAAGHYFGGGKLSAGGFQIPIGFLAGGEKEDYRQHKWELYDTQIKQKIFAKIGFDKKKDG